MSNPDVSSVSSTPLTSTEDKPFRGVDWLVSISFGEGFKRCISLLRQNFRWLFILFLSGGITLSIILWPINSLISTLENQLVLELIAPLPDFDFIFFLLTTSVLWGLVRNFTIFFGVGILNAVAIYHVMNNEPTLLFISPNRNPPVIPVVRIIVAAFLIAGILTGVSIIPIVTPFIQVFFFFIPALFIIDNVYLGKAFRLSSGMRRGLWLRILGAIVLSFVLMLFAGQLGITVYLNIQVVFQLFGIPLGVTGSFLLIILIQIPVAMVAPFFPLFSIVFYSGAQGAFRDAQHKRYQRRIQRRQAVQSSLMPWPEEVAESTQTCAECNTPIGLGEQFCTRCGVEVKQDDKSLEP